MTLRATSTSPLAHVTRVTLFRGSDRVEIQNEITQNFGGTREWRFSLNVANPDTRHEEVGAVVRARLTTQGGAYSATNARYDNLTLNHFVNMSGSDGVGVTLSNSDAYFMRLGNSTIGTLDTSTPQFSVVAGSSLRPLNPILNQAGDSYLLQRFALQSRPAYDQPGAMRFALEHQNPLATGTVSGGSAYPETSYSFLTISDPNVLLWSLKPAEEGIGEGVVARVWNLAATPKDFSLALNEPIAAANAVTHIETNQPAADVVGGHAEREREAAPGALVPPLPGVASPRGEDPSDRHADDRGGRHRGVHDRAHRRHHVPAERSLHGQRNGRRPEPTIDALPGTATIPAGAASAVVSLTPLSDTLAESDESVTVTLTPQAGYLLGSWKSATATIMSSSGTPAPPPPGTAVALYPFSEGAGTTTADLSGMANTGTIAAPAWTPGKYGSALDFNGTTSFVTVPGRRVARSRRERNASRPGCGSTGSASGTASSPRATRTRSPRTTTGSR